MKKQALKLSLRKEVVSNLSKAHSERVIGGVTASVPCPITIVVDPTIFTTLDPGGPFSFKNATCVKSNTVVPCPC